MVLMEEGVRLVEPVHVIDTFVSGLGEVEDVGGGCLRFTFYSRQCIDGVDQSVIVARLVAPRDAVPAAVLLAARAAGMCLSGKLFASTGLN